MTARLEISEVTNSNRKYQYGQGKVDSHEETSGDWRPRGSILLTSFICGYQSMRISFPFVRPGTCQGLTIYAEGETWRGACANQTYGGERLCCMPRVAGILGRTPCIGRALV